jgi:DivIVA domain-containing protein
MELTPELFETIEFTERRKGYDTDEVETFLEEAGTALAQLLARYRQLEQQAAGADGRIAEAEQRAAAAEQRANQQAAVAADAGAAASAAAAVNEQAEVDQAARTLLMARRTAEAIEADARQQSQVVLGEAKTRADRQLGEAQAEADELIRRARIQAEQEYAERRVRAQDEVVALEERRSQLGDVITQLEARLAGYREDLSRTAEELSRLASDPDRLGARPTLSIPPDEVLPAAGQEPLAEVAEVAEVVVADADPATSGDWAPGSWSQVAESDQGGEPTVAHDQAGDELEGDDAAMQAFFEGGSDDDNRRFGWRR